MLYACLSHTKYLMYLFCFLMHQPGSLSNAYGVKVQRTKVELSCCLSIREQPPNVPKARHVKVPKTRFQESCLRYNLNVPIDTLSKLRVKIYNSVTPNIGKFRIFPLKVYMRQDQSCHIVCIRPFFSCCEYSCSYLPSYISHPKFLILIPSLHASLDNSFLNALQQSLMPFQCMLLLIVMLNLYLFLLIVECLPRLVIN